MRRDGWRIYGEVVAKCTSHHLRNIPGYRSVSAKTGIAGAFSGDPYRPISRAGRVILFLGGLTIDIVGIRGFFRFILEGGYPNK
jgi:hypothetical protein